MIEEAHEATVELVEALGRLVPELSATASPPDMEAVKAIVDSEASHLLIARNDAGQIVGALSLVIFVIPTGIRAWIEDVIVASDARGQGIGKALTTKALKIATERGARTVDLTSRPSRQAANSMYERLGFAERKTRIYRYDPRIPGEIGPQQSHDASGCQTPSTDPPRRHRALPAPGNEY